MSLRSFLESVAVLASLASNFVLNPVAVLLMLYLLIFCPVGRYFALVYIIWIYLDQGTAEKGGRRQTWFRKLAWWKYHKNFFPVTLHKTAELPPNKNYFIGAFPHGVVCAGTFSAFTTDSHDVQKDFPGIKFYLATITLNFLLPLFRELMHALGVISVSKKSLDYVLSDPKGGKAVVVQIGGAKEAAFSGQKDMTIVLKNRKGFCKLALNHGASLVPCLVFGEKDLFYVVAPSEKSLFHKFQQFIKDVSGVLPIVFYGSDPNVHHLLPKRVPLHVVVGKPIEVERTQNPTQEQIDFLHQRFTEDIIKLYNDEKLKYDADLDSQLIII